MQYVDRGAYEAIDEHGSDYEAFEAVRDRALCALIGYSGVRGSELLNQPHDDRDGRSGATWEAVDFKTVNSGCSARVRTARTCRRPGYPSSRSNAGITSLIPDRQVADFPVVPCSDVVANGTGAAHCRWLRY